MNMTTHNEIMGRAAASLCSMVEPVGSRVTCNPAPTDTDADYLVFVAPCDWSSFVGALADDDEGNDWNSDGSDISDTAAPSNGSASRFRSFSRDGINLIVTDCTRFYARFMAASSVAKRLNLLDKADRVALFQAVLYGNAVRA